MKGAVYTSQSYCFQLSVNSGEAMHLVQVLRLSTASGEDGIIIRVWGEQGWRWAETWGTCHLSSWATNTLPDICCAQPLGAPLPGGSGIQSGRCHHPEVSGTATPAGGEGARVCSQIALGPPRALGRAAPERGMQRGFTAGGTGKPMGNSLIHKALLFSSGSQHGSVRWWIWNEICKIRLRNQ